ncbi:histidinol dehydrogenase [Pistricoccus aurantiacus]|uniref:histidinol dehydrogenase n=1 Tax=Pistricoccus aurantiacus TaxID=1883414 RepID=UPI001C96D70B|nr:histidinol dehydrogenase [Pistricoccus aurantiacus]
MKTVTIRHLKSAAASGGVEVEDQRVTEAVSSMLNDIHQRGETALGECTQKFDNWIGDFVLSDEKRQKLIEQVPQQVKDDIDFAHRQVQRFAKAQRDSLQEFEIEIEPGVILGQRILPVHCAGCYILGGRYAHAASELYKQ